MSTYTSNYLQQCVGASDTEFRVLYWLCEWSGRSGILEGSVADLAKVTRSHPVIITEIIQHIIDDCSVGNLSEWCVQGDHDPNPDGFFKLFIHFDKMKAQFS